MIDGYNIVDNVQQPQLTFNETTAVETAAITTPGWYQIVVTKNAFIKIVREGQSALTVSPTTGFDIFMTARQTAFADTASFQSFGIIISSIYAYKNQKGREGSSSSTSPHS